MIMEAEVKDLLTMSAIIYGHAVDNNVVAVVEDYDLLRSRMENLRQAIGEVAELPIVFGEQLKVVWTGPLLMAEKPWRQEAITDGKSVWVRNVDAHGEVLSPNMGDDGMDLASILTIQMKGDL